MNKQPIADTMAYQAIRGGVIMEDKEIVDKDYNYHRFRVISFSGNIYTCHYKNGEFVDGYKY